MTVFNFPDTTGQPIDGSFTWTAPSGVLYVWNGEAWVTQGSGGSSGGGSKVYVTDDLTTIDDPEVGDLAYHTVEARLYVYYQDSDSQQWVDASPAGDANDAGGDSLWSRVGSTLSPAFTGDDITTTGDLSAAGGYFSGSVLIEEGLTAAASGTGHFIVGTDGGLRVQREGGGATIQVQAANVNGSEEGSIGFLNSANSQFYSFIGTGRTMAAGYSDYTLAFRTESTLGDFSFFTGGPSGSERMRIVGSTGDVYIGGLPSSPNITLQADGSINASPTGTSAGVAVVPTGGSLTNGNFAGYNLNSQITFSVKRDGKLELGSNLNTQQNVTLTPTGEGTFISNTESGLFALINEAATNGVGSATYFAGYPNKNSGTEANFAVARNGRIFSPFGIATIGSERRLKEDIQSIDPVVSWETIKSVPYYSYKYIGTEDTTFGPIVDELPEEMLLDFGRKDDQGPIRTYDSGMLQARLYTALQTALTRIEALEATNASLEARLTALEGGN